VNVGEMQRKLSQWAEQDRNHRFFDLYHLLRLSMTDGWRARCREIWHGGFGEGSGETCLAPGKPKRSANATRSAPTLHKCESFSWVLHSCTRR